MSCPYVIRESIGFDHVREHGYYHLDEMTYDLIHDFAGADVEVITRPVYNVVMESGERLSNVDDETVFKMLSAGLPVKYVENARDGDIMYSRPKSKPVSNAKAEKSKVGGITIARDWMVVLVFIEPAGNVESHVMENKTERDAKWYLELSHDPERVATYNHEYGGLLSAVVTFEKTNGNYVQRGRIDF